jgi:hypothetical protein
VVVAAATLSVAAAEVPGPLQEVEVVVAEFVAADGALTFVLLTEPLLPSDLPAGRAATVVRFPRLGRLAPTLARLPPVLRRFAAPPPTFPRLPPPGCSTCWPFLPRKSVRAADPPTLRCEQRQSQQLVSQSRTPAGRALQQRERGTKIWWESLMFLPPQSKPPPHR